MIPERRSAATALMTTVLVMVAKVVEVVLMPNRKFAAPAEVVTTVVMVTKDGVIEVRCWCWTAFAAPTAALVRFVVMETDVVTEREGLLSRGVRRSWGERGCYAGGSAASQHHSRLLRLT